MAKSATSKAAPQKAAAPAPAPDQPASPLLEFFCGELKDIYWAENQLTVALPKMQQAATGKALAKAIGDHLKVTKTHVARLEQVFELLGKKPQAKKCEAMAGITKEGESILEETEAGTATRDVGIIMAAQKAEHYEIATYGCLVQLATNLSLTEVANLLYQTLAEEKEADETLTAIAESTINAKAAAE